MTITGKTRLIPIVGHPVAGVYTPPHVNAWLAKEGIDAVMTPLDIAPEGAGLFFDMLRGWNNLAGCSVTHPYKERAFEVVNTATPRAAALGVVNTIRRDPDGTLHGDMTDGEAMVAAMRKADCDPHGKSACIVGAGGGAGRAIVAALCDAGIHRLQLRETDPSRRRAIVDFVSKTGVQLGDAASFSADIVVNATTLGTMQDDPLALPEHEIGPSAVYCDLVNAAHVTPLLAAAQRAGAATVSGAAMGAEQIALQMGFVWAGRS